MPMQGPKAAKRGPCICIVGPVGGPRQQVQCSVHGQVRHFFRGYNFTDEIADKFFDYLDEDRMRSAQQFFCDFCR